MKRKKPTGNALCGLRGALSCVVVIASLLLSAAPASASFTHFREPSAAFPFSQVNQTRVEAIGVDQVNHFIYIAGHRTLTKYTTAGQLANFSALGSPTLELPQGARYVAVDSSGNIYAVGNSPSVIYKYLPSGEPDPTTPEIGTGTLPNHGAAGIGIDSTGDIYIAANRRSNQGAFEGAEVDEFAANGVLLNQFGSGVFEAAIGELGDLSLDSVGHVYVASGYGLFAFNGSGSCLNACAPIDQRSARAIAVEPGTDYVYMVHRLEQYSEVIEFDSAAHGNSELGAFGSEDLSRQAFGGGNVVGVEAKGLAVDGASGDVYIPAETTTNVIPSEAVVEVFGPNIVIPTVHISTTTDVQPTTATFHGTVNTAGTDAADALTACHYDYVTEEAFLKTGFSDLSSGGEAPCEPPFSAVPDDGANHAVNAAAVGLAPATTYRVRLFAENENGHNQKEGEPFTSAGAPLVDTQSVDGIGQTAATLHAEVNPFELHTHAHFEYISAADYQANGSSYGGAHPATSTMVEDLGQGLGDQQLEAVLGGLARGTEYHYRVSAENSAQVVHGPDQTFITVAPALFALQAPTDLTSAGATLHVYINPLGRHTSYRFEYGTSTGYGNVVGEGEAGEGSSFGLHSVQVTGLEANTEYHFRTVATNSLGTAASPDFTFTTQAANCPNEVLREEDSSTQLPDCRAYEQVSPEQKGLAPVGGGVAVPTSGPTDHVLFDAEGSFAGDNFGTGFGSPYLARRTPTGWATESVTPPPSLGMSMFTQLMGVNSDLTETLTSPLAGGEFARNVKTADAAPSGIMYIRKPDGTYTPASPLLSTSDGSSLHDSLFGTGFLDASPDLSQIVFGSRNHALFASASKLASLYELVGANGPTPEIRVLSVDGEGNALSVCSEASVGLGGSESGGRSDHEISDDGSKVFFFAYSSALAPGLCSTPAIIHALVRVGGQSTIDLAAPEPNEECSTNSCRTSAVRTATFQGAAADGSKAFFTSQQQLTDEAHRESSGGGGPLTDCAAPSNGLNGCNLYEYDFNRAAGHNLIALSALQSTGINADVRRVVGSADDGSLVYFVARGLVTSQPNALGQIPQDGAENMYVVNTETGGISFIALRCTGSEESGTVHEIAQCPSAGVDETNPTHFDLTPDGRFLLFSSYGQLTPDDTNQGADLYRYDAQTGSLLRVSIGHNGEDANGNAGGQNASAEVNTFLFQMQQLAANHSHVISDNGSTIAFTTARPLQEGAESGVSNVYEWRQGQVSLVSNGRGGQSPIVSPSGDDIFFGTEQGLIPSQDKDEVEDYFDARVGGGFPLPKQPPAPCESPEGCGRPSASAPPPPTLGTPEFRGPAEGPGHPRCNKGYVSKKGHCVKKHRKHRSHKRRHHRHASSSDGGGK